MLWRSQAAVWPCCSHPPYPSCSYRKITPAWCRLSRSCTSACAQPRLASASQSSTAAAGSSLPQPTFDKPGGSTGSLRDKGNSGHCSTSNGAAVGAFVGAPTRNAEADGAACCSGIASGPHAGAEGAPQSGPGSRCGAGPGANFASPSEAAPPRPERDGSATSSTSGRGSQASSSLPRSGGRPVNARTPNGILVAAGTGSVPVARSPGGEGSDGGGGGSVLGAWDFGRQAAVGGAGAAPPAAAKESYVPGKWASVKPRLQALLASGDLPGATAVVERRLSFGKQPPWQEVSQLITALCGAGGYPAAWRIARQVHSSGFKLPIHIYHLLIVQAGKAGEADHVLWLYREQLSGFGRASVQVRTSVIFALLHCRRRGLPLAALAYEAWLQLLASGEPLDVPAYLAGVSACVTAGRRAEAELLLQPLCAVAGTAGGPHVVAAHNLLLRGAARAADAGAARRAFATMRARGVAPDRVTYNTLAAALSAAGEGAARARAILEHAAREGFEPDAFGLTAVLRAHALDGDLDGARAVLDEMAEMGVAPTAVTYGVLADAHVRRGDLAGACALAERMEAGAAAARRRAALGRATAGRPVAGGDSSINGGGGSDHGGGNGSGSGGDSSGSGDGISGSGRGVTGDPFGGAGLPAPTRIIYNTILRGLVAAEQAAAAAAPQPRPAGPQAAPSPAASPRRSRAASSDESYGRAPKSAGPAAAAAAAAEAFSAAGRPQQQQQQQQLSRVALSPQPAPPSLQPASPHGLAARPRWPSPAPSAPSGAGSPLPGGDEAGWVDQLSPAYEDWGSLDSGSGYNSRDGGGGSSSMDSSSSTSTDSSLGVTDALGGGSGAGSAGNGNGAVAGAAAAAAAADGAAGAGAAQVWSVQDVLRRMSAQGIEPGTDTYSIIMEGMLKRGDLTGGAMLLEQLQGPTGPGADTISLTGLMVALGAAGDCEAALDVFDEMLTWETPGEALRPPAAAASGGGGSSSSGGGGGAGPGVEAGAQEAAQRPQRAGSGRSAGKPGRRGGDTGGGVQETAGGVAPPSRNGSGGSSSSNTISSSSRSFSSGSGDPGGSITSAETIEPPASCASASSLEAAAAASAGGPSVPSSSDSSRARSGGTAAPGARRARSARSARGAAAGSGGPAAPWRELLARRPTPPVGGPDVAAWNALVDLLVSAGRLQEAEAALDGAVEAAGAARRPPPAEAFGALIKGLRRSGQLVGGAQARGSGGGAKGTASDRKDAAQRVLRRFLQLGGQPTRHMCDDVIALCLAAGDVRSARQVVRVMRLTGVLEDSSSEAGYQSWLERRQQQQQKQQQQQASMAGAGPPGASGADGDAGGGAKGGRQLEDEVKMGVERLKWFFGLKNRYYLTD